MIEHIIQCMYNLYGPSRALVPAVGYVITDLRIYGFTPLPPPPAGRPRDADLRIKTSPDCGWRILRSLDEFSETDAGLPYSLWALPDCSWWLGWLVWLVRLWGTQVFVSLSLKMSRNTIRVFVVPPL